MRGEAKVRASTHPTGVLLAAGASRRFGAADKLLALLDGQPLVSHAAAAMRGVPLARRIAVVSNPAVTAYVQGFEIVTIPSGGQADSLRAGLEAAGAPERLLVALGDMPDVTPAHLARVIAAATDEAPAASHDGTAPLPPACFPRRLFPALAALEGDRGAGSLLRDLPPEQLIAAPRLLRDIDRPKDLARR